MPFIPEPFIDDDTLLPQLPWSLINKLSFLMTQHHAAYEAAHAQLVAIGVTFYDHCEGDVGGVVNLRYRQNFSEPGESITAWWDGHFATTGWFPAETEEGLENARVGMFLRAFYLTNYPGYIAGYYYPWVYGMRNPLRLFEHRYHFWIGMTQRLIVRMHQHRIAQSLVNIFGIDNRGRPKLE